MRAGNISLAVAVIALLCMASSAMAFTPVNIAPDATASGSTAFSDATTTYSPSKMIDGSLAYAANAYISEPIGENNGFFQLDWTEDVTFDTITIYNTQYYNAAWPRYNLWDFDIRIDDGQGGWTVLESVRGGSAAIYTYVSPTPLTTSKLYFDVITPNDYADGMIRVIELQVMSAEAVPEPMTISLLAAGSLALLRRRRNR